MEIRPGEEYDGVTVGAEITEPGGSLPAQVSVAESTVINRVSPWLFGYNYNWRNAQVFVDPNGPHGFSADLLTQSRGLPMRLNRMSGTGSQCLKWKLAVGPAEKRPAQKLMPWGKDVPVFGPVEWIRFCQTINPDSEFTWTFNLVEETPEDAADIVAFLTGSAKANSGRRSQWAATRVEYGLAEPVPVVIWELGNELDHYRHWDEARYVESCRDIIAAVRKVAPDARFAAHVKGAPWSEKRNPTIEHWRAWHRYVLKHIGQDIDWLTFHPYYEGVPTAMIERYLRILHEDIVTLTGENRIGIYLSEHARWPPRRKPTAAEKKRGKKGKLRGSASHSLFGCLATADFYLRNLRLPYVKAAAYHSFRGGVWAIVQHNGGSGRFYRTGMYDLFLVFDPLRGWEVLKTTVNGPQTDLESTESPARLLCQVLKHGDQRAIVALNRLPETSRQVTLRLPRPYRIERSVMLTADSMDASNTVDERRLRLSTEQPATNNQLESFVCPPRSLSVIYLQPVGDDGERQTAGPTPTVAPPALTPRPTGSRALSAPDPRWENLNPGAGGRIVSCHLSPGQSGRVYYCSDMEGISRSDDGGETWVYVGKELFHGYSTTVASDPADPDRAYAGTHYGLHISDNAGANWRLAEKTRNQGIGCITVHPDDPNTVFAGPGWGARKRLLERMGQQAIGERFIFVSSDRGRTWTRHVFEPEEGDCTVYSISVTPGAPQEVTVASGAGLHRSADGGVSWTRLPLPENAVGSLGAAMSPAGDVLYAALTTPGISGVKEGRWKSRETTIFAMRQDTPGVWHDLSGKRLPTKQRSYRYARPVVDPRSKAGRHRILTASRSQRAGLMEALVEWHEGRPTVTWKRILFWQQAEPPTQFDLGWETHTPRPEWYAYTPVSWESCGIWTTSGQALFAADSRDEAFPNNWRSRHCKRVRDYTLPDGTGLPTYRTRGVQCTYNYDMAAHENYVIQCQADNGILESWDNGQSWSTATKPRRWRTTNSQAVIVLDQLSPPVVLAHSAHGYGSKANNGELFAKRLDSHSPADKWVLIAGGEQKLHGLPNAVIHDFAGAVDDSQTVYLALKRRGIYRLSGVAELLDALAAGHPPDTHLEPITVGNPLANATVRELCTVPDDASVLYAVVHGQGIYRGKRAGDGSWSWALISSGSQLAVWSWQGRTVLCKGLELSLDDGKSWQAIAALDSLTALASPPWLHAGSNLGVGAIAGVDGRAFLVVQDWVHKRGLGVFELALSPDGSGKRILDISGDLPLPAANRAKIMRMGDSAHLYLAGRQNGLWRTTLP